MVRFDVFRVGNDVGETDAFDVVQVFIVDVAKVVSVCVLETLDKVCAVGIADKECSNRALVLQDDVDGK